MADTKPEKTVVTDSTKLELTIPWKDVAASYEAATSRLSRGLKLDGFRKGKVPASVAEKMLNPESIIEESLQTVLPPVFSAELEKSGKKPLGRPAFSIKTAEKGSDWVIIAEIAEKPELAIKGYEKVVKKARAEAETAFKKEPEEGAAQKETAKELEKRKKATILDAVYKALLEEYTPQCPELLVRQEVEHDAQDLMRQLKNFHFTLAQYLERRKLTEQELSQELAGAALGRLQLLFLIDAVAAQIKLEISDAEIDTYLSTEVSADIKKRFEKDGQYRALIGQTLVRQKVADHLLAL